MAKTCKAMPWYGKTMVSMARFCQVIQSFGHFLKVYVQLWPSYTKSWQDMTKLYKYIQVMAKHGKLVQSYSQIWAIYTKICSEVLMLCKITAKIGQVIQSSGQFIQIYVQIWLAKMVKLHKGKDFFSGQPVVSAHYLSGILFSAQFSSQQPVFSAQYSSGYQLFSQLIVPGV